MVMPSLAQTSAERTVVTSTAISESWRPAGRNNSECTLLVSSLALQRDRSALF